MYQSMAMQSNPMRQAMYAQVCQPMLQFVMPQGAYTQAYAVNNVQVPVMPTTAIPKTEVSTTDVSISPKVLINEPDNSPLSELPNDLVIDAPAAEVAVENLSAQAEDPMGVKLTDMMKEFIEDCQKVVRITTLRAYKSLVKSFSAYVEEKFPDMRCQEFYD